MRFKIDWASLIVSSFVFEGNQSKYKSLGGLYLEGRFSGGFFLCYEFWGLIFGGAYTWSGLFSEFYDSCIG